MSEWQTPAAVTFNRTWPGPGSGSGTVTTSGGAPIVRYCSAFMTGLLSGLQGGVGAVDQVVAAGHEGGAVGEQEDDQLGDLLRAAEAGDRVQADQAVVRLLVHALEQRGLDEAGADGV